MSVAVTARAGTLVARSSPPTTDIAPIDIAERLGRAERVRRWGAGSAARAARRAESIGVEPVGLERRVRGPAERREVRAAARRPCWGKVIKGAFPGVTVS
ncbi:hypothetical protein GCM10010932_32710 [Agromyces flavus]|nr:hypothetical protein GCM10010932_32710 [Agromyces flavus]